MTPEVMECGAFPPMLVSMTTTLIDVGPSKLAYTRTGRGPDLVFVHGWPLHGATFRHIVPALSDRFTCHVIDLPGTGASVWTADTRFSIDAQAEATRLAPCPAPNRRSCP